MIIPVYYYYSQQFPDVLDGIETKLTIQSYEKSNEYNKLINLHCIGDWNIVVISSQEKLKELILTMNIHQEMK